MYRQPVTGNQIRIIIVKCEEVRESEDAKSNTEENGTEESDHFEDCN